ncbi:MAG: Na+/H+ antiporter subunit E [Planctomycetota bacterium]
MRVLLLAVLLAALWLSMSGHFEPLLLGMGAAAVLLVTWVAARMRIVDEEGLPVRFLPRMLVYGPWLLKEIVFANLSVARTILAPKLVTKPNVFTTDAPYEGDVARTLYANSITLTPGTVTIDVGDECLLVHALTDEAKRDLVEGEMLRRIHQICGGDA